MLQQPALVALIAALPAHLPIEVETNGTLNPQAELLARINQWNISPKLANCGEAAARRLKPDVLSTFATLPNAWLKFVVESKSDVNEVEALLQALAWPRERVLWMPQAQKRSELKRRLPQVRGWCLDAGLRLSPRLHVELWDGERGR